MGILEKARFHAWDPTGFVEGLLKAWTPEGCCTEREYELDLVAYLKAKHPDFTIVAQYSRGRSRADIVVEERALIEINRDLATTTQYRRLLGQLDGYKSWGMSVCVVLVGTTDESLLVDLCKYMDRTFDDGDWCLVSL